VKNNQSSNTPDSFYSYSRPRAFSNSEQICFSKKLLQELGLKSLTDQDVGFLSGCSDKIDEAFVTRYGGHQFGHWARQLGDGRAHTLGQYAGKWDVQVKGSGPNPYSRSGDGFAVLRSSLREFLMSEYMNALGVPTTRALNLMTSGEDVLRDMFYNGNAAFEKGALVTRVAPSFLRFGHFEIFKKTNETANLKKIVQWTVEQYFPNHKSQTDEDIFEWFDHICKTTLELAIHWMRVGFVHGVLNSDNMSILGLTIDYGPFSMLDEYDRTFTPNTTDLPGRRYSYENQPAVCLWNLERLAEALAPLVSHGAGFSTSLEDFKNNFRLKFESMFQEKLGLPSNLADSAFVMLTENLLQDLKLDFTLFFSTLNSKTEFAQLKDLSYKKLSTDEDKRLLQYLENYKFLIQKLDQNQMSLLNEKKRLSNPKFNLRNYMFFEILEDMKDSSIDDKLKKVMRALEDPYNMIEELPELYLKRPDWAKDKAGCTFLSCSS
jgi:uncharacterized protein YdiU (UPF0061 family)